MLLLPAAATRTLGALCSRGMGGMGSRRAARGAAGFIFLLLFFLLRAGSRCTFVIINLWPLPN